MKAERTNSKLGGMTVVATILTVFLSWGMASAAEFHAPGLDCTDCHDISGATTNRASIYNNIDYIAPWDVTFIAEGTADYARDDDQGVCEACHWTDKGAHIDDMELGAGDDCTTCHGSHCADTPNPGDPGMFSSGAMPVDEGVEVVVRPGRILRISTEACPDAGSQKLNELTTSADLQLHQQ